MTLLVMMSLSRHHSDKMRGSSVALLAPWWEKILSFKQFSTHPTHPSAFSALSPAEEMAQLQVDNQLLATEISYLHQLLNTPAHSSLEEVSLPQRLKTVPARVIFRSFDQWNSSLWINRGETTNQLHQATVIAPNSPVVIGKAIVGIIDYVGQHQSRVRLITDNRLTLAVRASRGEEQDLFMTECVDNLLKQLNRKKQFNLSPDDQERLVKLLKELKQGLTPHKKSWYLAKGELLGSPFPARRGQEIYLKGTGFNYDFQDEEGEGRDLRTGKPLQHPQEQAFSLLKVHDVLVTTGMDGIFPPGFQVATVTKVGLLKEGDYFYELEAKPLAGPLEELALVFVLPPLHAADQEERLAK